MTGRATLTLVGVFFALAAVSSRPAATDIVVKIVMSIALTVGVIWLVWLTLRTGPAGPSTLTAEVESRSIQDAIDRYGADAVLALCTQLTDPVPDPGHPGGMPLVLWQPPTQFGRIKVLECFNGTAQPDGSYERVAIGVDAAHTDPIAAAAESYGIDLDTYRRMSRRV